MTIIKKKRQALASIWRKENPCALLVGMNFGTDITRDSMEVP